MGNHELFLCPNNGKGLLSKSSQKLFQMQEEARLVLHMHIVPSLWQSKHICPRESI